MSILKTIRSSAVIAASALVFGVTTVLADGTTPFEPTAEVLQTWQTSLDGLRDMTPKWGIQPVEAFKATIDAGVPIVMIDVRTPAEWAEGVVEGAVLINLNQMVTPEGLAMLPEDRMAAIGVYCKSGHRSALALSVLHQLGYINAINMGGGITAWRAAKYPIATPAQ